MLRHKLYCHNIASLLSALIVVAKELRIVATVFFTIFFNNVATEKLFVATYENHVLTKIAAFSTFLLLFCLFFFQITPAKHKVGEYSIFWHKNRYKISKNMPENGLKIDEFKTHQIPLNLKFCLSPSKEKKFCLSSNNSAFYF